MADLHARVVAAVDARVKAHPAVQHLAGDGACSAACSKGLAWDAAPGAGGLVQYDVRIDFAARTRDELHALVLAAHDALSPPFGGTAEAVRAVLTDTGPEAGGDATGWTRTDVWGVHTRTPALPDGTAPGLFDRAKAAKRAADKLAAAAAADPDPAARAGETEE